MTRTEASRESARTRLRYPTIRSVRRNPVTVCGALTAVTGALTAFLFLDDVQETGGSRSRRSRSLVALAVAAVVGAAIGRMTQRWTWSGDRVTDELIDAELALWDETDSKEA